MCCFSVSYLKLTCVVVVGVLLSISLFGVFPTFIFEAVLEVSSNAIVLLGMLILVPVPVKFS